jgi:hypothetical protein
LYRYASARSASGAAPAAVSRPASSRTAGSAAPAGKSRAVALGAPSGSAQVRELTAQNTEAGTPYELTSVVDA